MLRLLCKLFILPLLSLHARAQPPVIEYPTPQIYIVNKTVVHLSPLNTGGSVPAVIHNEVSTLAGSGIAGGDDGIGTAATFQNPSALTTDDDGNLYVTDSFKSTIRKITPDGRVTTIAGGGKQTFANGNGKKAFFSAPFGIARDPAGNLFVSDANNNQIRKITPSAEVTTFSGSFTIGNADGPGTTATFFHIVGLAIDAAGNLYLADSGNALVRKVAVDGSVTTFAGNGTKGNNDGPKANASFNVPASIAADIEGNLYISDFYNHTIRKVTAQGTVSTLAGSGTRGYSNGTGAAAGFNNPWGLAADYAGNVYVADYANNMIRKITQAGKVSTVAGTRTAGAADGPAALSGFNNPIAVAADRFENLYVADFLNNKIRKITLGGYTIDKPLPDGLVFDPKTGIISGRPKETWPATEYSITAYNAYGNSSFLLSIEVSESLVAAAKIPNVFSPNGDGSNDTWNIRGLVNDPECIVTVFNRSGTLIFRSVKGYLVPWDGQFKGQELPVGVYYYLLLFSDGQKTSGPLSILK